MDMVKLMEHSGLKLCFQTDQMSPSMVEARMEGADPCHDFKEGGPGADGCW